MPLIHLQVSEDLLTRLIQQITSLEQAVSHLTRILAPSPEELYSPRRISPDQIVSFDPDLAYQMEELLTQAPPELSDRELEMWLEEELRSRERADDSLSAAGTGCQSPGGGMEDRAQAQP